MLACIATVVQRDYDLLWTPEFQAEIEAKKGTYSEDVARAMDIAGLIKDRDWWSVYTDNINDLASLRRLFYGRRAILQVPSLNYPKTQHAIAWVEDEIFDPSHFQVYQWIDQLKPVYAWIFRDEILR